MNLKQIQAFRELMLTGSVSEAARNLRRTQPAVSHTIAGLETDLGMKLFERRGGRLHPVPEAHYLFEECKELLNRINTVSQNMRRIQSMERGELLIASMPGPSVILLPDLISKHVGGAEDVRTTLLSRSSDAVYQLVSSQQFDLGIADHDPFRQNAGPSLHLKTFQFTSVCALRYDDPLASKTSITPTDLRDRPMATLYREHASFRRTRDAFQTVGVDLKPRFETQFFIPLLNFVEQGLACAIVDPLTAESYRLDKGKRGTIAFKPFVPTLHFDVALLTPAYRPASRLAATFAEFVAAEFTKLGGRSG